MISQLVSPGLSPASKSKSCKARPEQDCAASTYKAFASTSARVYHAAFGSKENEWVYSGLKGSLVFGRDRDIPQGYSFHLLEDAVDAAGPGPKTIWIFKIPETNFEYRIDKPFFHCFRGCSRHFGFLFNDDEEAAIFARVVSRTMNPVRTERPFTSKAAELPRSIRSRLAASTSRTSALGRLSPSPPHAMMISAPLYSSFVHVAHVGLGDNLKNGGPIPIPRHEPPEQDSGVEPESWTMVLPDVGLNRASFLAIEPTARDSSEEYTKAPILVVKQTHSSSLIPHKIRRKPTPKISTGYITS
ncbi:hypothetical protein FB45DRAFT_42113 [Roridomyces roridus]|uniref:Uncharacterized protein n=1 Tax=Roridomyces roridus TaxID=1738132 RepID=A0AAD7FMS1_9AGAR|nr:hypothetical protein FB45DRAFT_42113 [Roridomyces roridus]